MDTYILRITLGDFGGLEQKGETSVIDKRKLTALVYIEKDELGENAIRLAAINLAENIIEKLKEDGILGA